MEIPSLGAVREAAHRIRPHIHRTPVLTCRTLDRFSGARLFFKCENLQKTGAFKIRGAANVVLSLSDSEVHCGVATHSSGNHAAALAYAAAVRGIKAFVVMPENSSMVKIKAVREYGAEIVFCTSSLDSRRKTLENVIAETGARFVPPYDHPGIIAGQGTAAMELVEAIPELDAVIVPVGGGGLLSGTSIAVKETLKHVSVYAGEPEQADDAFRSLRSGHIIPVQSPDTIADGLRTSLGEHTFAVIQKYVDEIFTVPETDILRTMYLVWQRMKIIIEPSSAVPVAAVLNHPGHFSGKRIAVIISGGNVDFRKLPPEPLSEE